MHVCEHRPLVSLCQLGTIQPGAQVSVSMSWRLCPLRFTVSSMCLHTNTEVSQISYIIMFQVRVKALCFSSFQLLFREIFYFPASLLIVDGFKSHLTCELRQASYAASVIPISTTQPSSADNSLETPRPNQSINPTSFLLLHIQDLFTNSHRTSFCFFLFSAPAVTRASAL